MLHFLLSPWSAFWNISFPWFYFSGIYHEPKCRKDTLDHGLLLVGYGYEGHESENRKYWLLKNRYMLWKLLDFKIRMDFLLAVGFLDTSHRTHCCIKLKKEHVLFCCSNLCVCECGGVILISVVFLSAFSSHVQGSNFSDPRIFYFGVKLMQFIPVMSWFLWLEFDWENLLPLQNIIVNYL
jgi:hypothetical protein